MYNYGFVSSLGRDETRPKRSGRAKDFGELSRAVHLGLVALVVFSFSDVVILSDIIVSLLYLSVPLLPIGQIGSAKMCIEPIQIGMRSRSVPFCIRKVESTMGKGQNRRVAFRHELVANNSLSYQ